MWGQMILACSLDSGRKLSESKKYRFSTIILSILVPSIINWHVRLSSREFRSKNCLSYPWVMWNNLNLIRKWSGLPEIINKFTYGVFRPKPVDTLTTLFTMNTQVIHRFTFGTHLLSTYEAWSLLKGPIMLFKVLCTLRSKKTYINGFVSLLGLNGTT